MDKHNGKLPSFDTLRNIWKGDVEDAESNEILLWYMDKYMEVVAGRECWNKDIRTTKLVTDKIDVNGKEKIALTSASEAFGLLVYDNCRDKWQEMWKFYKENPGVPIPKDGEEAQKFLAKYTKMEEKKKKSDEDSEATEVDGDKDPVVIQGWSADGLQLFNELMIEIYQQRQKDAENGKKMQKHALEMVRKAHNITESSAQKKSGAGNLRVAHPRKSAALLVLRTSKHEILTPSHKILALLRKIFPHLPPSSRCQIPVADYSVIFFPPILPKILHPCQEFLLVVSGQIIIFITSGSCISGLVKAI